VEALCQQLKQAWGNPQERDAFACTLDAVFDLQWLGAHLLSYVASTSDDSDGASAATAQVREGLALVKDNKDVKAYDYFTQQLKQVQQQQGADATSGTAATSGASTKATIEACIALCSAKLGVSPTAGAMPRSLLFGAHQVSAQALPPVHPLQHLANAVTYSQQSSNRASDYNARRQADLRCAGEALAMLLHPGAKSGALADLVSEAVEMLKTRAPAITSPVPSVPQQAGAGLGAGGSGGRSLSRAWQAHLQRYPSLAKLQGLTGLAAVKSQMFSLADQVRPCIAAVL
jgi:hypothetical protein